MTTATTTTGISFDFPVGYRQLHKTKILDYQLNRWYSFGYLTLADVEEAAGHIGNADEWKAVMVGLADKALAEGRTLSGTFLYRAAEFFTRPADPDKLVLYDNFIDLFYNELFPNEPFTRHRVPYGAAGNGADGNGATAYLPALRLPARGDRDRGLLVVHGGFDSFIEELYSLAVYFSEEGYEVIMFEGPGQGGALRHAGLPFDYEWEKPAKAVLDYFDVEDVSWLGISMGGWLCFRAAALEPRISRVIASSIAFDYMQIPPKPVADFARWLLRHPGLMEPMTEWKMKLVPQERWGIENLMFMTQSDTALAGSLLLVDMNEQSQMPEKVTQDVLILTGKEDHFVPMKLHHLQMAALTNARSLTGRVFTREEQGHNHCQIGNFGLALEVMAEWLAEVEAEREGVVA